MSAVVTHLWSSTLVVVLALLLARALPLTARTRHALLLCGVLKFAIPYEAVAGLMRLAGINRRATGAISIEWIGAPAPLRRFPPPPEASLWPKALLIVWIASAFALAIAWAIARRRLVVTALGAASPASPREREALANARRSLGVHASIDITRSTICEAPAVVRLIRPVVVLPDGGCDALDDSELESLLRHECAHVARRDNLIGLFESAVVAAFWFHPLVWYAQRAIATAREEACDETAATSADRVDTYVSALSKVCSAVLAARVNGVSCMASAHLKERLNHIMNYEVLRKRALSHRFVLAFAAILVLGTTVVSGVDAMASDSSNAYSLEFTAHPGDPADAIEFTGRVRDNATGLILARPSLTFKPGAPARVAMRSGDLEITVDLSTRAEKVIAEMGISRDGALLQHSTFTTNLGTDGPRNRGGRRYTGSKISIDLKDADINDVLKTFSKLTGMNITCSSNVKRSVTFSVKDMPWDQAFDLVLQQNGLTWRADGDNVTVIPQ